jgi:hypothetical protein
MHPAVFIRVLTMQNRFTAFKRKHSGSLPYWPPSENKLLELDMVANICNFNSWEAEAGGFQV